jgi:hypothetical protein
MSQNHPDDEDTYRRSSSMPNTLDIGSAMWTPWTIQLRHRTQLPANGAHSHIVDVAEPARLGLLRVVQTSGPVDRDVRCARVEPVCCGCEVLASQGRCRRGGVSWPTD